MCKLQNLFRAVSEGNLKLVTKLLTVQNIIDQDWKDYELLLLALKQNQKRIAKILLDHGCRVQDAKKDFIDTPIYYVIEMQDSEMIQLILNKNFSFNSIDHKFQSPFQSIIKLNDRKVVSKILNTYVNEKINPTDYAGFCPFHIACYVGDTSVIKYFLNIDQCIINRRVKNSARNFPGFSPLHFAAQSGDLETIEILLSRGSDITLKDKSGMSAFHHACVNKKEQIRDLLMKILFERNAHCVQDKGFSAIFKSLMYRHMIQLNRKYEDFDAAWDSWTPLHYAVTLRKPKLVELLLKKKVNVDAKDSKGLAPLHLACQCSFEELSKTISTNNEGLEFEMYDSYHYEIQKLLTLQRSKFRAPQFPQFGFSKFEKFEKKLAVNPDVKKVMIEKRKKIIRLLLHHGAEVNITDNIGATPLHDLLARDYFFEESDKIEIIEQILNKGADVNAKTKDYIAPLYLALRYSFLDVARILIDHNADVKRHMKARTKHQSVAFKSKKKRQQRFSPIYVLLDNARDDNKKLSILKLLLEKGADPSMRDSSDYSLLEWAIFHDQTDDEELDRVLLTLLQFGAEVNSKNRRLQTALHRAYGSRNYSAASVLLNYGADINAVDVENRTPLHLVDFVFNLNDNFFCTIKQHVIKLKHIGLHFSQENEKCLQEIEEIRAQFFPIPEIGNFSEQCAEEVDRLRKTKINKYTTMYDILIKGELIDLATHVNDTFKEIVESNDFGDKFKFYGLLLKLKYEKSLRRKLLVDEAEEALKFFTNWKIPDLCIRMIIENLNNKNLQVLIIAHATNVNVAHQ